MKSNPNPDPLSQALQRWRLTPGRDRNFRDAVWQRIGREARLTWAGYVRAHGWGWSVAAMAALIAAGWSGQAMAQARLDAARDTIIVSYLSELDPRVITGLQR